MIHLYCSDGGSSADAVQAKIERPNEKATTPTPKYRVVDDAVIDDILNTLREEENAAHE